jgi:hypothetical protein
MRGLVPLGSDGGGWVIAERYPLMPLPNGGYRARTRLNVVDSDGIAILLYESISGGTRLTRNLCALLKRPYVLVDARQMPESEAVATVTAFVETNGIQTLNVEGPRASKWKEGYQFALAVISGVIEKCVDG